MSESQNINHVNQEDNSVEGDLVGRDKFEKNYHIGSTAFSGSSQLEKLYSRFEEEKRTNATIDNIIDELQHYKNQLSDSSVLGLNVKLENGNRAHYLEFAMTVKEKFTKKLLKNEHSESAQEIYAFLLAKVYSSFQTNIKPRMTENHPEEYITRLIHEHIIKPLEDILGDNLLKIYEDDIHGMIYFLTGNCHLNWN